LRKWLLIGLWVFASAGSVRSTAQISEGDSLGANTASDSLGWPSVRRDPSARPANHRDSSSGEILLQDIEIKGNVDKPGVVVLPKRLEPETEGMDLDRNFEKELKKGTSEVPKPEKELQKIERVESIKDAINKKRK
jgi:hypothetical protein